ncbi:TonB-dependent receptor [Pseudomaricurvus alkylphenolicus]|uniref:TonB-dependent receptor n=1 Tax=Pseudomaricurvus alkylphenolicus TaxID=1306991 RepID=UPI001422FA42|nr:TonB-dependent receptor [Pseudomaricurvus alkylphenolicus]NIB41516.1 TonB-dependent receptor [Pseudomaricurvus alkylphenolicus]
MKRISNPHRLALAIGLISASLNAHSLEDFALEEVVVTAQKRSESMQEVPVAVSAIGSEDIEALGWDNPTDVASQVPNMQVSAPLGDAQPIFAIRGISMADYNPSQASPIGVYADEAYLGSTYTHGLSMFDIERIEVLRGPQGTLYGKNTTGGAINIITRNPELDGYTTGYTTLGVEDYDGRSASMAVESPLIDGVLGARLALKTKKDEGKWDNHNGSDMAQTDYRAGRLTLNWQPTDELNALLKITSAKSTPRSSVPRAEGTLPGGMTLAGVVTDGEHYEGATDYVGKTETEMTSVNLKVSYDFENFTLVSVSSFYDADYLAETDTDGTTANLLSIDWQSDSEAFGQDLRLVSSFDGPFNFIAGLYYGHEDINTDIVHHTFFADPVVPVMLNNLSNAMNAMGNVPMADHFAALAVAAPNMGQVQRGFDVVKESYAVYTHMTYDINDNLGLTVGLRYTEDENRRNYINYSHLDHSGNPIGSWLPNNLLSTPFIAMGIDAPFVTSGLSAQTGLPAGMFLDGPYTTASGEKRSVKEDAFTGKIALDYQLNADVMLYASYSKGFRSGSFNNGLVYADQTNENGAYAAPEYVDAYEVGVKSEFFDSRVRLNANYFFYEYEDQQFVNQVGISAQLVNAGGADIQGLEVELLAMPMEGLTVQAGLGLIDAEYTELNLPRLSTPLDPADTIDLKGNQPVSSPELNFNFALDYEFQPSDAIIARAHFDGTYTDEQWFSAYNELDGHSNIRQDSYWIYNARVTLSDLAEKYALSLWVQNLTEEEYDVYAINLQGGFGYNYFLEGAPRTYGVDFTVRF